MVVRVYDFLRKRLFQISVKSQFITLSSMNCKLCSIDNQKEKNQIFEKQLIWIIYSIIEKSRAIMTFWQNSVKTIRLSVDFTKIRNFALKIIWQNFREINVCITIYVPILIQINFTKFYFFEDQSISRKNASNEQILCS